jgi:hypothetical protein
MGASKIDYVIGIFYLLESQLKKGTQLYLEVFEPSPATDIKYIPYQSFG